MPCKLAGRRCEKCRWRGARELSDLCGRCFAGANVLERALDVFIYTADACERLCRR